jgi:hypothetical protein
LTRTPLGLNSAAQERVNEVSAAFVAPYAAPPAKTDLTGHAPEVDDAAAAALNHPRRKCRHQKVCGTHVARE